MPSRNNPSLNNPYKCDNPTERDNTSRDDPTKRNNLGKRLSAIAELVRPGASVCDVGTDHAFLPCYLAEKGHNLIYACDVNPKPLNRAKAEIARRGLTDKITLSLSDGLSNIPECDDVIIAGMGGELISEIVEKCHFKTPNLRLILQPMTRHEVLRRRLYELGFAITREKTVKDGKRLYIIILARYTGNKAIIDDVDAYIGSSGDADYIRKRLVYLENLSRGDLQYLALINEVRQKL